MSIAENVARVRERMHAAERAAGREPGCVQLMAVSKTMPPEKIREAYQAGLRLFGENRVQEFVGKCDHVNDLLNASFHLIGRLQSNKVGKAVEAFHQIDSIDSLRLAERVNEAARSRGQVRIALIEVNVGGEKSKAGVDPVSSELEDILRAAPRLDNLLFFGLMTVPPYFEDPEKSRVYFRMLRKIRDEIIARNLRQVSMHTLSMGMSHDYEVAISEGSTCVRLGTAIFGPRPPYGTTH